MKIISDPRLVSHQPEPENMVAGETPATEETPTTEDNHGIKNCFMKIKLVNTLALVIFCVLFVSPAAKSGTHYGNNCPAQKALEQSIETMTVEAGNEEIDFTPITSIIPGYHLLFN